MTVHHCFGAHEITQLRRACLQAATIQTKTDEDTEIDTEMEWGHSPFPEACVCERSLTKGETGELLTDDLQVDQED